MTPPPTREQIKHVARMMRLRRKYGNHFNLELAKAGKDTNATS